MCQSELLACYLDLRNWILGGLLLKKLASPIQASSSRLQQEILHILKHIVQQQVVEFLRLIERASDLELLDRRKWQVEECVPNLRWCHVIDQ